MVAATQSINQSINQSVASVGLSNQICYADDGFTSPHHCRLGSLYEHLTRWKCINARVPDARWLDGKFCLKVLVVRKITRETTNYPEEKLLVFESESWILILILISILIPRKLLLVGANVQLNSSASRRHEEDMGFLVRTQVRKTKLNHSAASAALFVVASRTCGDSS